MPNKVKLFKVKEGKLDTWKEWCVWLQKHEEEVLKTLEYEGWKSERCYLFTVGDEHYVLGTNYSEGEVKKADMTNPVNVIHFDKIKECLEPLVGETLFEFKR